MKNIFHNKFFFVLTVLFFILFLPNIKAEPLYIADFTGTLNFNEDFKLVDNPYYNNYLRAKDYLTKNYNTDNYNYVIFAFPLKNDFNYKDHKVGLVLLPKGQPISFIFRWVNSDPKEVVLSFKNYTKEFLFGDNNAFATLTSESLNIYPTSEKGFAGYYDFSLESNVDIVLSDIASGFGGYLHFNRLTYRGKTYKPGDVLLSSIKKETGDSFDDTDIKLPTDVYDDVEITEDSSYTSLIGNLFNFIKSKFPIFNQIGSIYNSFKYNVDYDGDCNVLGLDYVNGGGKRVVWRNYCNPIPPLNLKFLGINKEIDIIDFGILWKYRDDYFFWIKLSLACITFLKVYKNLKNGFGGGH